jgi:hypothetical protein
MSLFFHPERAFSRCSRGFDKLWRGETQQLTKRVLDSIYDLSLGRGIKLNVISDTAPRNETLDVYRSARGVEIMTSVRNF